MPEMTTLDVLLTQEIKELYSAETQLVRALPKMAKAAATEDLKNALMTHLEETLGHVSRLEEVAELLGINPKGKFCNPMMCLVNESTESMTEGGDPIIIDLALIGAARRVEHYEIAGYAAARDLAEALGVDAVVELLEATMEEEGATDVNLALLARDLAPMAIEEAGVA